MNYCTVDIDNVPDDVTELVEKISKENNVSENQVYCDVIANYIIEGLEKKLDEAYEALMDVHEIGREITYEEWEECRAGILEEASNHIEEKDYSEEAKDESSS